MNYQVENPVKYLRSQLAPTKDEIVKRSPRDKTRQGLLQHEMAKRLRCSTSTIRDLERDEKPPTNQAILANFNEIWKETFEEVLPDG